MYRRRASLRMARLMSRLATAKRLDDEASAGWIIYGTSPPRFHLSRRHRKLTCGRPVNMMRAVLAITNSKHALIDFWRNTT
jgi:hypothetical protein